jgi:hypothetical protein
VFYMWSAPRCYKQETWSVLYGGLKRRLVSQAEEVPLLEPSQTGQIVEIASVLFTVTTCKWSLISITIQFPSIVRRTYLLTEPRIVYPLKNFPVFQPIAILKENTLITKELRKEPS